MILSLSGNKHCLLSLLVHAIRNILPNIFNNTNFLYHSAGMILTKFYLDFLLTSSNYRFAFHFSLESRHMQTLANCPAIDVEELVYDRDCEDFVEEDSTFYQHNIEFGPKVFCCTLLCR